VPKISDIVSSFGVCDLRRDSILFVPTPFQLLAESKSPLTECMPALSYRDEG
jgi:hypothetical protein